MPRPERQKTTAVAMGAALLAATLALSSCSAPAGGIGTRVFVVERATGTLAVIDYETGQLVKRIKIGGNLRHASMVFGHRLRYGYVASRSGHLLRVDLHNLSSGGFVKTSRNSIGLAISQDGRYVAVSEYKPGGVTIVDTRTFEVVQRIPASIKTGSGTKPSRVTGLVDGPGNRFYCALMDGRTIWELSPVGRSERRGATAEQGSSLDTSLEARSSRKPYRISKRITTAAPFPFDALITPEGGYYLTGHFRSDVVSLVNLRKPTARARAVRTGQSSGITPVKMPHMESWAAAGNRLFVPLPGENRLSVLTGDSFRVVGSVPLIGHPVYAVVRPDHRELWVTFSGKEDGKIQVIDPFTGKTIRIIEAGRRIYHLVFTPRGNLALVSSNRTNEFLIISTETHAILRRIKTRSPSGIFGVWRAFRMGL